MVKGFLSELDVAFTVRDVSADAVAREEFLRRGFRLPPVVVIDGQAVEGFQPDRIVELIAAAEQAEAESGPRGESTP